LRLKEKRKGVKMMLIENNFAKMDLNNFKQKSLELFVKNCYKYQKFNRTVAIKKFNYAGISEKTALCYFGRVTAYLHYGTKANKAPKGFYEYIDKLKAECCPILTPADNEKARVLPKRNPLLIKKKEHKENASIIYGVKIKDNIKVLDNEYMCNGYIACYKDFINEDIKKITVEYKECE
jgi:hypothetical protein